MDLRHTLANSNFLLKNFKTELFVLLVFYFKFLFFEDLHRTFVKKKLTPYEAYVDKSLYMQYYCLHAVLKIICLNINTMFRL